MAGACLSFNDAASTEALIGFIQDIDSEGNVLSLESSRQVNKIDEVVRLTLSSYYQ